MRQLSSVSNVEHIRTFMFLYAYHICGIMSLSRSGADGLCRLCGITSFLLGLASFGKRDASPFYLEG